MDVAAYLDRIAFAGPLAVTPETLKLLQQHHLRTVPFENLDIALGRRINIDREAFVRKVVQERRGGFCYELNGAFAGLLETLGFPVTLLSARVSRPDGNAGPEFDHLALRVDLAEPWLVDVGFGDSFAEPLRLQAGVDQQQGEETFRITSSGPSLVVERLRPGNIWTPQYQFSLAPRQITDFAEMCHLHQTSPASHFTQKRICSRATPAGRITLSDRNLIIRENGVRQEWLLESEEEWKDALHHHFGIVV